MHILAVNEPMHAITIKRKCKILLNRKKGCSEEASYVILNLIDFNTAQMISGGILSSGLLLIDFYELLQLIILQQQEPIILQLS